MSNPNWNKDTNAGRSSNGGVKGNWSDRGTNSVPEAKAKEKAKSVSLAKGNVSGTCKTWVRLLKVESIIGSDLKILNGKINGLR